jgi:type IV pilus assembly protein PilY1
MNTKTVWAICALALIGLVPKLAQAQVVPPTCTSTNINESFTGATNACTWTYYGGACMTAGSVAAGGPNPGFIPMCGTKDYLNNTQVGGNAGTLPDSTFAGGALRLTNDANSESGAIISNIPFALGSNGVSLSFTTETYEGDSGSNSSGGDSDGADGISFFLQDASQPVTLGDYGGSLGYTCSNSNNSSTQGYDGMIGAYLGLGIDEYGNFLDGTTITNATTGAMTNNGGQDNTSTGYGKLANRVGLRGAGSTAWSYLSSNTTPSTTMPGGTAPYYPTTLTSAQRTAAVLQACQTGIVWNYASMATAGGGGGSTTTTVNGQNYTIANPFGAIPMPLLTLPNYAAIPNAFAVLPKLIANEAAKYRGYSTSSTTGTNYGIPITYHVTITTGGLLSLSYSYNGANFIPVITRQSIGNVAAAPSNIRFGFAASTGGSRNIHEVMCFQAAPQNSSQSSAGLNQKQTAKVQTGTQVYFAYYNSNDWTGSLTSQSLVNVGTATAPNLQIDSSVNWDASCVLTGTAGGATCASTGAPNVPAPNPDTGRTMLTWYDGGTPVGIPFVWSSLSGAEQSNLNHNDPTGTSTSPAATFPTAANSRLEYLRGARGDEQNANGVDPNTTSINPSGFRQRVSVLGDIVDSSPTWVGAPSAPYPAVWQDFLNPSLVQAENSGPTYASFANTYAGRTNVVYAGANDGFMHGFRTGSFNSGTYVGTYNDGHEVLAYMPAYVLNSINSANNAGTSISNTADDYTNPLYAHRFNVDATPGTGEVFYNGGWHSWLVGGLGAGGNSIFVLDITNPDNNALPNYFSQGNANTLVIGEWSSYINSTSTLNATTGVVTTTILGGSSNLNCVATVNGAGTGCGNSMGKTFGTPQIRKFHNATSATMSGNPDTSWGAVFGNGSGSFNGDAGIYVMIANNSGAPTFYYLSTGVGSNYTLNSMTGVVTQSGTPNGIYFVTPADLDGDHIVDYVYAGDLLGNVWRFDLTNPDPTKWAVTSMSGVAVTSAVAGSPLYSTGSSSLPISTKVVVASIASVPTPRVLVEFGTGRQTPFSNTAQATYATGAQYLIGIWDWNLSNWNSRSGVQYDALSSTTTPHAPSSPISGQLSTTVGAVTALTQQTVQGTYDTSDVASSASTGQPSTAYYYETISNSTVNWADTSTTGTPQYGWYLGLSSGYGNPSDANGLLATAPSASSTKIYEQVIFNPTLQDGAFIVNTTIPPTTTLAACASTLAGGWTMAVNPATGGAFTNSFFGNQNGTFLNIGNSIVSGIALSGTGSPSVVAAGNASYIVTQTISGTGAITQINPPGNTQGSRLTWIEKR